MTALFVVPADVWSTVDLRFDAFEHLTYFFLWFVLLDYGAVYRLNNLGLNVLFLLVLYEFNWPFLRCI